MGRELKALDAARRFSDEQVKALRADTSRLFATKSMAICVVGSYGRGEASEQSDLDFFLLQRDKTGDCRKEIKVFRRLLSSRGIKMPSMEGAFNSYVENCHDMARDIGGFEDKTEKLTRRLLFLLEGDWLYNETLFNQCFKTLVEHYVRTTITEHQLCRFLLNDLIRYYRTICVDFECKTHQDGKSWGDRNIKLQFSRKLLYFSGILVVAETWQSHWETKREILTRYLRQTPIERIQNICGAQAHSALAMYDSFLERMADPQIRKMLQRTPENRKQHSPEFRKFKNEGHHFMLELSRLLAAKYDSAHPIQVAIKF